MSWNCPECSAENSDDNVKCYCGRSQSTFGETSLSKENYNVEHKLTIQYKPKYPALALISTGYKLLAWLVIPLVLILILVTIKLSPSQELSFITIATYLFYGFSAFITLYAISEVIQLFMDIEENTRKATMDSE